MMVALFSPQRRMLPAIVVAFGAGLGAGVGAYAAEVAPSDSLAAVMRPTRSMTPMGEIHLQPAPGCTAGTDCAVTVTSDLRPAAGDKRRVGFIFEAPASGVTSEGAWRCRPLTVTDTICLARPGDSATPSRLTLRLPAAAEGKPEPKLCARPIETGLAAGTSVDPRQVRLLQALLDDARGAPPSVPDGELAGETRQALVARAREVGLGNETEAAMLAVVLGQELNRSAATLPACLALITPPPAVARATPEAQPKPAKPAVPAGTRPPVASAEPPPGYYRPPVYVPAPFDDNMLVRPWRGVRPFTGLRRLFGG
jgi:hypothetical protein